MDLCQKTFVKVSSPAFPPAEVAAGESNLFRCVVCVPDNKSNCSEIFQYKMDNGQSLAQTRHGEAVLSVYIIKIQKHRSHYI